MKLKPIEEQVVVVFGASSGIGRETALEFARRGAKVVVAARREEGLQSLVEEIEAGGGEAVAAPADASDFEQVQAVAARAVAAFGRIDTWVHLAAVSIYARFEDTTPEEFQQVVAVNLIGQVHGAMAALPHLKRAGGGALIHVSSIEARRALPFQSAYASAKHGIKGFLDALRVELQHDEVPISVTEIMPASINTPLFNKARTKLGVQPMGVPPFYEPGVVADAILYAAGHPTREMYAGGAGKMIVMTERASPKLMDALLRKIGFRGQKTDIPVSEHAPDGLFEPLPGYDRARGDFSRIAFRHSLFTWTQMHPWVRRLAVGALAGTALVATGWLRGGR